MKKERIEKFNMSTKRVIYPIKKPAWKVMRKLFVVSIIFFSMPSFANWEKLNDSGNSNISTYYFKKGSYKTFLGRTELTSLSDLKIPEIIETDRKTGSGDAFLSEAYLSIVVKFDINCNKDLQRILSVRYYSGHMGKGLLLTEIKEKSSWFGLDATAKSIVCK